MTRYWFYLTFDVDSFLAIQRKYEVNHSYVCYCENTKYTQHDEKRRKYKHQYSLVIFRRKKGETSQSIVDMLSLKKSTIYHVHTMRISLSIVTRKELPKAFSRYCTFDLTN